jgi:hypothetical protein
LALPRHEVGTAAAGAPSTTPIDSAPARALKRPRERAPRHGRLRRRVAAPHRRGHRERPARSAPLPMLSDFSSATVAARHQRRRCFGRRPTVAAPGISSLRLGDSSDAVARPPTVPSMTRRAGRPLPQGPAGVRLSNQLARSGGAAASPRRATSAVHAPSASRSITLRTAGSMQQSASRGATAGCVHLDSAADERQHAVCSRRSRSRAIAALESPRTVPRRSDERQQRPRFGMRR